MSVCTYDQIARSFWDLYDDLKKGAHSEYMLKGGRGSTKSSFISIAIVAGLLRDPLANAIIYRRVGNTLKDSVYAQMMWAIETLGLKDYFRARKSPLEIEYKPTGQRILFRGTDDPLKSKSIKLEKGYFKFLWFEELAEFRSMEDVRTIKQSILRGVDEAFTLYSYNPPKSAQSWVNGEALKAVPRRLTHTSSYLDVPKEWLGQAFIFEAESLRESNFLAYRNEYLGEVTGSGGNVFENVETRTITDDELKTFGWFYQGIDWGWFPDPFQWVRCAYDAKKRILYIVDEYRTNKAGNEKAYTDIKDKLSPNESLVADSAEPKSVADFRSYGAGWIRGAVKGPGSVDYSMKWLASLKGIVIDPHRTPAAAKEFVEYEYERNNAGEYVSGYVDANNHAIDAVRYAMSPIWKRHGE